MAKKATSIPVNYFDEEERVTFRFDSAYYLFYEKKYKDQYLVSKENLNDDADMMKQNH